MARNMHVFLFWPKSIGPESYGQKLHGWRTLYMCMYMYGTVKSVDTF